MPFLLRCPHCGPREATEFVPGGEVLTRPAERPAGRRELSDYLYFRRNTAGPQREWWFHAAGCERWVVATRNTVTGEISEVAPAERAE